jgi:hypothetical protein
MPCNSRLCGLKTPIRYLQGFGRSSGVLALLAQQPQRFNAVGGRIIGPLSEQSLVNTGVSPKKVWHPLPKTHSVVIG